MLRLAPSVRSKRSNRKASSNRPSRSGRPYFFRHWPSISRYVPAGTCL